VGKNHTHTSKCYGSDLKCAKTEHSHSDRACYYQRGDKEGTLKCSTDEHSHGSNCYMATGPFCGHE
jgi:hypothetical protein